MAIGGPARNAFWVGGMWREKCERQLKLAERKRSGRDIRSRRRLGEPTQMRDGAAIPARMRSRFLMPFNSIAQQLGRMTSLELR